MRILISLFGGLMCIFMFYTGFAHSWMAVSGESAYGADYYNWHSAQAREWTYSSLLGLLSLFAFILTGGHKKRMADLKSNKAIFLKAFLFCVIVLISSFLVIIYENYILRGILLVLDLWAFARLYYFFFYVLENYIDEKYKYSGIFDQVRKILKKSA